MAAIAIFLLATALAGCNRTFLSSWHTPPPVAHNSEPLFVKQMVNTAAPHDRSPDNVLPGNVAAGIYENRYKSPMTEKADSDDDESVSDKVSGM